MTELVGDAGAATRKATLGGIFLAFLLIGATSFGGGVITYLRSSLVDKHGWLDDREFVELLSISQTLPGLNATNVPVLVGDRLRGALGAAAAVGLILATTVQLGRKSLHHVVDLVFVALTVIGVNVFHQSVPRVLFAVGVIAILWYRPRAVETERSGS